MCFYLLCIYYSIILAKWYLQLQVPVKNDCEAYWPLSLSLSLSCAALPPYPL